MSDFKQAVKWKLEGKAVFHQGRNMILNDDCLSMSQIDDPEGKSLDNEDFYYDAWEIYEDKKLQLDTPIIDTLIKEIKDIYVLDYIKHDDMHPHNPSFLAGQYYKKIEQIFNKYKENTIGLLLGYRIVEDDSIKELRLPKDVIDFLKVRCL